MDRRWTCLDAASEELVLTAYVKGEVSPGEGPGRGVEKRGHAPREASPLESFRLDGGPCRAGRKGRSPARSALGRPPGQFSCDKCFCNHPLCRSSKSPSKFG